MTTEAKKRESVGHTPGPWKVRDRRDLPPWHGSEVLKPESFHFVIQGQNGFQPACILGDGTENRGTAEANARLIAAAPELLEAAKDALNDLHILEEKVGQLRSVSRLCAAIAKAEGGER